MAPKFSTTPSVDKWWLGAYDDESHGHIAVQYEFEFEGDIIKPKTPIKMKNTRGTFKFRCLATNVRTGSTWIDCIDNATGEWRSFRVEKLKCIVKPKKSRRRKKNVEV